MHKYEHTSLNKEGRREGGRVYIYIGIDIYIGIYIHLHTYTCIHIRMRIHSVLDHLSAPFKPYIYIHRYST
jgi:hypothetical protein